jgi:hypothetical protein
LLGQDLQDQTVNISQISAYKLFLQEKAAEGDVQAKELLKKGFQFQSLWKKICSSIHDLEPSPYAEGVYDSKC